MRFFYGRFRVWTKVILTGTELKYKQLMQYIELLIMQWRFYIVLRDRCDLICTLFIIRCYSLSSLGVIRSICLALYRFGAAVRNWCCSCLLVGWQKRSMPWSVLLCVEARISWGYCQQSQWRVVASGVEILSRARRQKNDVFSTRSWEGMVSDHENCQDKWS